MGVNRARITGLLEKIQFGRATIVNGEWEWEGDQVKEEL
jgi:hypothetical protein